MEYSFAELAEGLEVWERFSVEGVSKAVRDTCGVLI